MFATQTFPKNQKLCHRTDFQLLLNEGNSFYSYPFICKYRKVNKQKVDVQIAISVSKRKFKKAVDRNKIKRLIRETYRKEKYKLFQNLENKTFSLHLLLIYSDNKHLPYHIYEKRIIVLIDNLIKDINVEK